MTENRVNGDNEKVPFKGTGPHHKQQKNGTYGADNADAIYSTLDRHDPNSNPKNGKACEY